MGLSHLTTFKRHDIFKADMQPFQSAVIFGAELMMDELVPKLDEMREGANLICCRFPLPPKGTRWKLLHTEGEGIDTVWLYKKCPYVVDNSE
uniref:Uncharacterized protein n=1 Tax=Steinernema glaseri TaxID=37863 RepID=A0A1I8ATY0_9BILA